MSQNILPSFLPAEPLDQVHFCFRQHSDHQIRFLATFDGHVDVECLGAALQRAILQMPILLYRFEEQRSRAIWVRQTGSPEPDYFSVRTIASGELDIEVARLLIERADPFTAPALRVRVLRHAAGDVLCIVIDHTVTDGGGFKHFLQQLFLNYLDEVAGRSSQPSRFGSIDRDVAAAIKHLPWRARLRMLLPPRADDRRRPWSFDWTAGSALRTARFARASIDQDGLRLLRTYARANRCTLNDVLLTALFRALDAAFGANGALPAVDVPVDLRKHVPSRVGLSNFSGPIRCALLHGVGNDFHDALMRVKNVMDAKKVANAEFELVAPLIAFRRFVSYPLLKRRLSASSGPHVPLFTNLGEFGPEPFRAAGVRHAEILGSVSLLGPLSVAASSFGGVLHLSSGADATQQEHEAIESILMRMRAELLGAAADCGKRSVVSRV